MLLSALLHTTLLVGLACAHGNHGEHPPISKEKQEELVRKWETDVWIYFIFNLNLSFRLIDDILLASGRLLAFRHSPI